MAASSNSTAASCISELTLSTLNCLSKEASEGLNLGVMRTVARGDYGGFVSRACREAP
jgi:hypothetical protein